MEAYYQVGYLWNKRKAKKKVNFLLSVICFLFEGFLRISLRSEGILHDISINKLT